MSFELYCGDRRTAISPHEDFIFSFVVDDPRFPSLNELWQRYYSDPTLSPEMANALVHELLLLKDTLDAATWARTQWVGDRLLSFFSAAYRERQVIRCTSD
jgi:outer membrane cobalamin receptor